jgi:hypothetical protein
MKTGDLLMQAIHSLGHSPLPLTCLIQPVRAELQRVLKDLNLVGDFEVVHHPLRLDGSEPVPDLIEYSDASSFGLLVNDSLLEQIHTFLELFEKLGETSESLLALVVLV